MLKQTLKYIFFMSAATLLVVGASLIISPLESFSDIAFAQTAQPQGIDVNDPNNKVPEKIKNAYNMLADLATFGDGEGNEEDAFCKSKLLGTSSQETCAQTCPKPDLSCKVVQTHKAANNPELSEDTNCYGCAAAISCYDLGYIYNWPDCMWCEANPKKVCVSAVTFPAIAGIGGGAFPLPSDPSGRQCWDCIDRKDQCKDIWPGTTWDATCGGACLIDEVCQKMGVHPDGYDCHQCVKKPPPPPVSCYDLGLIYQADCPKCPPKLPNCAPANLFVGLVADDKGVVCFACFEDVPPEPPPPPPKPKVCADYGFRTPACDCGPSQILVNQAFPDGLGGQISCCRCEKDPCYPDLTFDKCKECEAAGKMCMGMTTVRGDVPCYRCIEKYKPPETCQEAGFPTSCNPHPCSANEDCSMQDIVLSSSKKVKCAVCELKDEPPPPNQCEEYGGYLDCSECFKRMLRCKFKPVGDRHGLRCYFCEEPCYDPNAKFGNCQPGICPEDMDCTDTQDGCHLCNPKPECEHGYYESSNCGGQCEPKKEQCVVEFALAGETPCYHCEEIETCADYEAYEDGSCNGKCKDNQRCESWGADSYWAKMSGLNCFECVDVECPPGSAPGVCKPGLCPDGQQCTTVGDYCHTCEQPVTQPPPKCEDSLEGPCAPGSCSEDQSCVPVGNECHLCEEKPKTTPQCPDGTQPGPCDSHSCSSDQECVEQDNCHQCRSKPKECGQTYASGSCSPFPCQSGEVCQSYRDCFRCVAMDDQLCQDGLKDGLCPGDCSADQICQMAGTHCYQCVAKPEDCPSSYVPGRCQPIPCKRGDVCQGLAHGCFRCVAMDDQRCQDGLKDGLCPGDCSADQICQMAGTHCYQCQEKTRTQPECPQGTTQGACTQSSCSSDQECVPAGENCHRCQQKKKTCEDMGMTDGEGCVNSGCVQEGGKCVQKTQDDYGVWCWECKMKPTTTPPPGCQSDADCDDGLFCNGAETCGQDGKCLPGDPPCHGQECDEATDECKDKKSCHDLGKMTHGGCAESCPNPSVNCVPGEYDEQGNRCYSCKYYDECLPPYEPGPCPQDCYECDQVVTDEGKTCHYCMQEGVDCFDGWSLGTCQANSCPEGQICISEGQCHQCQGGLLHEESCESFEMLPGPCPGQCSGDEVCVPTMVKDKACHDCVKKTAVAESCDYYDYAPGGCTPNPCSIGQCEEIMLNGAACHVCILTSLFRECLEPNFPYTRCQQCVIEGGKCVPAGARVSSGFTTGVYQSTGTPANCYKCEYPESCEKYGEASSCVMCRPGTICVPGKHTVAGPGGTRMICRQCIRPTTIEVTWVIIIIETPRGRYILEQAGGAQGFVPSQVMALAKVANPGDALKQLAGMLPGASSAFGMLNTSISMGSMGDLLKQSMEKSGKYADNCFEKDFKQEPLPKEAPASSGESSGGGGGSQYGKDPSKNMSTGGPIVACGNSGKEKALAILDAHGKPVEVITQSMLKNNPNAVMEALQKAQSASDQVLALREGGLQGVLDRAKAKIINKITSALTPEPEEDGKKGKKKKEEEAKPAVVPNDPFYAAPVEKKRKKLFGILGSSKEPKMFALGSEMKMGLGTIGATTAGSDKEKEIKHQWGLHDIGFTPLSDPNSAWNVVDEEKRNVIVAVIDSGFDFNHPDAPQYVWSNDGEVPNNGIDDDQNGYVDDVNGWNFLDDSNDLTDLEGHGTFVAGIIAAKTNNAIGIAGINPGAVIMPVKVADDMGETNSLLIARAIFYAVDNGAQIINVSLGARVPSDLEQAALNYAWAKGVFVAVASGNVNENIGLHGPASNKGAFAVGAIDFEGNRSTISNWGPNNGVLAPGDAIYSILATGTGKKLKPSVVKQGCLPRSGTSFSTPMVAATASLLLAQNPDLTNYDIEDILDRTAVEMYEEGWDGESGAGMLDAASALRLDVNGQLTLKINETRINLDEKKKMESVDVFATARGDFKDFVVELGKGKHASKFEQVAGPFTQQAAHDWVAHLPIQEYLRGSSEWIVRLKATDNNGQAVTAQTLLELK